MNVQEYLSTVAYVCDSDIPDDNGKIYKSKYDDSYIVRVGMEDDVTFLADKEITFQLKHGTGYSPAEGKWYGWSHRAIFGFKVGSTCKKGDCHYKAANLKDEIEKAIGFWSDEHHEYTKASVTDGKLRIIWKYNSAVPNKKLRGELGGADWPLSESFGRGEWTAKTIEDARQMAIDFNEGVS